jgi:hypothetical protein
MRAPNVADWQHLCCAAKTGQATQRTTSGVNKKSGDGGDEAGHDVVESKGLLDRAFSREATRRRMNGRLNLFRLLAPFVPLALMRIEQPLAQAD